MSTSKGRCIQACARLSHLLMKKGDTMPEAFRDDLNLVVAAAMSQARAGEGLTSPSNIRTMLIFYEGRPVLAVDDIDNCPCTPVDLLHDYAKYSGFPIEQLTFVFVNKLGWETIRSNA